MLGQYNGGNCLYHLDGNGNDLSGNGNNGTATNVTRVGGKVGSGAGSFNGTSSKILVPSSASVDITGTALTISVLCNPSELVTGYLVSNESGTAPIGGYSLVPLSDGSYALEVKNSAGTAGTVLSPASSLSINTWYNLIGVYNGTDLRLYKNGKLDCTPVACTLTIGIPNLGLGLGCSSSSTIFFKGLIDEIIIEPRAWSVPEIIKYQAQWKGRYGIL